MEKIKRVRRTYLNRTHNYIDIENLVGSGRVSHDQVVWAKAQFELATSPGALDLVTVGCDAANAFDVKLVFEGARIVCGHGPDGADLALVEAMQDDFASGLSSCRVTVGSGDHIFAPLLSVMATQGIITRVVGIEGHTSAQLRIAAHKTTLLPELATFFERTA